MARGVTQEQVNEAIEQLLLAGERPTIERVRTKLGTGSPNTLTRMLDTWWKGLGDRLTAQRQSAAVPDAPAAVVDAASALWEAALSAGQAHAEASIAPERAALAEALTAMDTTIARERASAEGADRARQAAVAAAEGAQAALVISDQRVSDLLRHVAQLEARVQELAARGDALEANLSKALSDAESARAAAAAERVDLQAHIRRIEDRAHAEIDRLRQDLKAANTERTNQGREHAAALRAATQARQAAEAARHEAEREAAAAQARVQVLERQLARPGLRAAKSAAPRRQRSSNSAGKGEDSPR